MEYDMFKNRCKLGNITLYNCDCMDLLKQTPDNYYSLCIVDPPYGININVSMGRRKGDKKSNYHKFAGEDNGIPNEEYFKELFRVSKNQIIWGANYFCEYLPNGYGWIFWNKKNGLDNMFSDGEFAFASKGIQSKYFECSVFHNLNGGKDRVHPTQKPVQLYKWILNKYAKSGDTILDTHLGSGSSAIAAHDGGFEFTGIELDEEYYNAAKERLILHQRQLNIF